MDGMGNNIFCFPKSTTLYHQVNVDRWDYEPRQSHGLERKDERLP